MSCKNGPPGDEFCAVTPNDGLSCEDGAGVCQEERCATCSAQTPLSGADQCFEPNCCSVPMDVLAKACSQFFPKMPHAVVCAADKAGERKCASLDFKPKCAWNDGDTYFALCCE
jgi:hypothetical protein